MGSIRIGVVEGPDRDLLNQKVLELLAKVPSDKREAIMKTVEEIPQAGLYISPSNVKLGNIMSFSLPPGNHFSEGTCPGATELCENVCYALKGKFLFHEYANYMNLAYLLLWPERFQRAFKYTRLSPVFRVHVGGDFFEPWYVDLWSDIARERNHVRFFTYTRSWQNGQGEGRIAKRFIEPLKTFANLPNVRLVLSADNQTGLPDPRLIPGSITAWLATDDEDIPPEPIELVFRHKRPSTTSTFPPDAKSQKTGSPVCPFDRLRRSRGGKVLKEGMVTCQDCAWCWGAGHAAYGRRKDDLSRFDMWARADLPNRVRGMFRQFVPWKHEDPRLGAPESKDESCICGAEIPCLDCARCIGCLCKCKS